MVEAPGTAPGSERFIPIAIYRYSRRTGTLNIWAPVVKKKVECAFYGLLQCDRRLASNRALGRAFRGGPADVRGGFAGIFVEDDNIEEQLAGDVFLAGFVFGDPFVLGPFLDVFVEKCLRITRGTFLAVIIYGIEELDAFRLGENGGREHRCGAREQQRSAY